MNNPVWIDERGKIIEPEYCRDFLSRHPIRCINDRFYTVEGPLPDESKLKRTIYEEISPWLHAKVAQTVEQIIKALKLAAYLSLDAGGIATADRQSLPLHHQPESQGQYLFRSSGCQQHSGLSRF